MKLVNKSVKVIAGKYQGLVGVVEQHGDDDYLSVYFSGVWNDEPISEHVTIALDELEVL